MSRTYDRLIASSAPARLVVPVRVPRAWAERIVGASEAEVRETQWAELTAHYQEHQIGLMLVLLRGGCAEMIRTYECPDCQRYGRALDQHQSGRGISDVVMEVWK